MTPRQIAALRYRQLTNKRETELMFSRLTAAVCNTSFNPPNPRYGEGDFMLHPLPKPPEPEPEPLGDAVLRKLKTAHWAQEVPPEEMRVN